MPTKSDKEYEKLTRMAMNPFYAINIEPALAAPHQPLISKETWVEANAKALDELGPEVYLKRLLEVLQGNYPVQDVSGDGGATGSGGFRSERRSGGFRSLLPRILSVFTSRKG